MLKEFQKFIARGNVMDLAVGVIVGGAFATITKSLTDDIIMPVVGWLFGGFDFSRFFIRLGAIPETFKGDTNSYTALKTAGVAMFGYGQFITVVINFIILAFIIFLIVRGVNRLETLTQRNEAKEAAALPPPPEPADVALLREIRDELKAQRSA